MPEPHVAHSLICWDGHNEHPLYYRIVPRTDLALYIHEVRDWGVTYHVILTVTDAHLQIFDMDPGTQQLPA